MFGEPRPHGKLLRLQPRDLSFELDIEAQAFVRAQLTDHPIEHAHRAVAGRDLRLGLSRTGGWPLRVARI